MFCYGFIVRMKNDEEYLLFIGFLPQAEKKEIVDKHNALRRTVAKGLESQGVDGPQPNAADMFELVWDEGLAASAQR